MARLQTIQGSSPYPALIVASRPLQAALYKPQLLPPIMDGKTSRSGP